MKSPPLIQLLGVSVLCRKFIYVNDRTININRQWEARILNVALRPMGKGAEASP